MTEKPPAGHPKWSETERYFAEQSIGCNTSLAGAVILIFLEKIDGVTVKGGESRKWQA